MLRKSGLHATAGQAPPFGGFATAPVAEMARVFMSPGPIFEPEGYGEDWWRAARALYRCGLPQGRYRAQHVRLPPDAGRLDPRSGARALGCAVIAAGPGNTEQQLEVIQALKPTAYVGVPDYLKILLDKAKETGKDATSHQEGAGLAAGRCFPRCGPSTSSAASPPSRTTPPPTSASSPTRARRWRA